MTELLRNILDQPASLRAVCHYQRGEGRDALERAAALLQRKRRVIISGMGASFFAGIGFTYNLNCRGHFAQAIEASELLYFLESAIDAETAVVLISRSGESVEVARLLRKINRYGAAVIGVTNVPGSTLAKHSTEAVHIASPPDEFVAIQTYTATLAILLLLQAAINEEIDHAAQDLERSCDVLSEWIPQCVERRDSFDPFLSLPGPCYLLARGPSLGTMAEGVLLMHETAKTAAIGMSVAQFRHGPVEAVDPDFHVVILGTQPKTAHLDAALANDIAGMGGRVRWLGPAVPGCSVPVLCPWPATVPERASAISETVPLQLLAYRQAELRGMAPGKFRWAPLVTTTESGFGTDQ
ncbi:MAG TPA: SIS domain-containing protein [Bryobacteraceae bacterium]|nr:SIS domain-containing protein [Bryobacteraceae bacterium]